MDNINKKIGTKLRKLRESKGYSQDYVATYLGIPQNSYSAIETGKTKLTIDRLFSLATVLNEPVYNILDIPAGQSFNYCSQQTVNGNVMNKGFAANDENPYMELVKVKDELIKSLYAQIEFLKTA